MTPNLKSKNFNIREFKQKDLKIFADYRACPSVAQYQSWTDYCYQDALKFFENTDYSKFGTAGFWFQLAIVSTETDELMGDLAIHFIDDDQIEIGFTMGPEFQNKGLASSALALILDHLFTKLNKHRVIAITDTKNISSCRLLEKLKFRREAHYIENIFFKGAWGDEYLYAILKSEYLNTKPTQIAFKS